MQVKLLHDLVEEMAGENTGNIVDIIFGKKNVNEFLIAKKMNLTINQVRNILYKLSAENLVSFVRNKDKRKGWYIYYWTLNTEKCLINLEQSLILKIGKLKELLKNRETQRFYVCKSCGIEVTEEKALDDGFSCEECAEIYELADNSGPIRDAKAKTTRTEKNLELIQNELKTIREKAQRKKEREKKKEEKEETERKALLKEAKTIARKKVAEVKKKEAEKEKAQKEKKETSGAKTSPKTKKSTSKKTIPKTKKTSKTKAVSKKESPAKKNTSKKEDSKKKNSLKTIVKKALKKK